MAAHGLSRYQRLPTRPERITVAAQKKIQVMYSEGLRVGCVEPNSPLTTTASRASTPTAPPMARGQGERATATSDGSGRRGYSTALAPTLSPAKTTTRTNEIATTPPAAYR